MAEIIIMPKLGFNMDEGKLVEWYKNEGDAVKKGEPLFSVETDKTNMDIEATGDGVVKALLINAGDKIPVTLPIAVVAGADEDASALIAQAKAELADGGVAVEAGEAPAAAAPAKEEPKKAAAPAAADGKRTIWIWRLQTSWEPAGKAASAKKTYWNIWLPTRSRFLRSQRRWQTQRV